MRARVVVTSTLFGLAVLGGAAFAVLYFGSQWKLRQLAVVPDAITVPTGGDVAEGARLASILGCKGCHAADLGGDPACIERPGFIRLTCPNVTTALDRYNDRDLTILLRHGRKVDGALVDFMPWDMYAHLTDRDLAHVIAFVRAAPRVNKPALPDSYYSWRVRWEMLRGEYPWQNDLAAYDTTPLEGAAERGRYLASISCPECHAPDLRGYEGDIAPSLAVVQAYPLEAFARLMREGIALTGRETATGFMSRVARDRFAFFTAEEIAALKAYFDQRSEASQR
jgi:hypothetical protein